MPDNDYLWDRSGEPDPAVRQLEELLTLLRYEGGPLKSRRSAWRTRAIVAAAVVAFTVTGLLAAHHASWSVDPSGEVRLDDRILTSAADVAPSSLIETGPGATATLRLGLLGTVTLAPNTRVSVEETAIRESRLGLEHGTISARIGAPPRLFYVSTPSAEAIDLGCAYDLSIDSSNGTGRLRVTHGWVALDDGSGRVYVPRGSAVKILGARRLSVPVRDDATAAFGDAVEDVVATLPVVSVEQAAVIDRTGMSEDNLAIWHLIRRADSEGRRRLAAVLASRGDAISIDVDAIARGDDAEIERVGRKLGVHESRWWTAWIRQGFAKLTGGLS